MLGYALCGSFCTIGKSLEILKSLADSGHEIVPIMSFNASSIDTRFGAAREHIEKIEALCGRHVIKTIEDAEPLGPKEKLDMLVICPCTGNTLAKLAGVSVATVSKAFSGSGEISEETKK